MSPSFCVLNKKGRALLGSLVAKMVVLLGGMSGAVLENYLIILPSTGKMAA